MSKFLQGVGAIAILYVMYNVMKGPDRTSNQETTSSYTGTSETMKRVNISGSDAGRSGFSAFDSFMPSEQKSFVAAIVRGQSAYKDGANEMAKGASRPARAKELCASISSREAVNWVGRISKLSSNNDGKGVLGVEIAKNAELKTWNNSFSDANFSTLLEPGSQLFSQAASMKTGQPVVFSGTLFRNAQDCFHESSMTISGSMEDPEFVFRFTKLTALNM